TNGGQWGWFYTVLNGTRTPSNVGLVLNQQLPWQSDRLNALPGDIHEDLQWVYNASPVFEYPNLMPDFTWSRRSLLDGMELLCEMSRVNLANVDITQPPQVNGVEDLERVKVFLDKVSTEMTRRAGLIVFANLPTR